MNKRNAPYRVRGALRLDAESNRRPARYEASISRYKLFLPA